MTTPASYYDTLGVAPSASPEEIRSAFHRAALRWHPDRNPGDPGAERRFKAAASAYETLRDPQRRRAYDLGVALPHGAQGPRQAAAAGHGGWGHGGRGWGRGCRGRWGQGCGHGGRHARGAGGWTHWTPEHLVDISLSAEEASAGCERRFLVSTGAARTTVVLQLPPGLSDGAMLRVSSPSPDDGPGVTGEFILRITIDPDVR